ncbi:peptidoglycan-binding domain-containing protein [Phyllobacterium phragmitis]
MGEQSALLTTKATLLRTGAKGDAVRELQQMLTSLGYPATPDGDFGPATARAVSRFQNDHGLEPDGIAGPMTFTALERALPPAFPDEHRWDRVLRLLSWAANILRPGFHPRITGRAVDKLISQD